MKSLSFVLLAGLILVASGCGSAIGSGPSVSLVAAPLAGYTCFAIQNAAGDTVGGNCIKDQ